MAIDQVPFEGVEHVSEFIPTEDLSVVVDDDLITEYEKRQYQPVSIYDQHQESLFVEGVQRFADRLANTEALQQWCKQPDTHNLHFTATDTVSLPGEEPYTIVTSPSNHAVDSNGTIKGTWVVGPGTDPRLLKVVRAVRNMDQNRIWQATHGEIRVPYTYKFSDQLDDYVQYQKLQLSHMFTEKVLFEMERNRPDVATWLVKDITSYDDKLRLFDAALNSDSPASDDVLVALGDLRGEAEQAGDIAGLTRYLMVELEHGMNPFENSRAVVTLLEDGNNTISQNSDEQHKLLCKLDDILLGEAVQLADKGDVEYARELLAPHPLLLARLNGRTKAMNHLVPNLDQPLPTKRRLIKPIKEELGTCQRVFANRYSGSRELFNGMQARLKLAELHLTYPQLDIGVDVTKVYIDLRHWDSGSTSDQKTDSFEDMLNANQKDAEYQGRVDAHIALLEEHYFAKNGVPLPTFAEPEVEDMSEYEYAASVSEGITDENIIPLFVKAASLTLNADVSINSSEKFMTKLYADLDLVVQHIEAARPHVMKDLVDQSRHRALYNSELTKLFEQTHRMPYATQQVEFLYQLLTVQRQHDTTEDSTYKEQKSAFEEVAKQCLGNPVAQLSLDEDTIREMCAEFDIDLGSN